MLEGPATRGERIVRCRFDTIPDLTHNPMTFKATDMRSEFLPFPPNLPGQLETSSTAGKKQKPPAVVMVCGLLW